MPDNHAFLSPSSSVRWYFCPPSARLCEQFPDQGSVFAAEGTEAHALCEYLLKKALGIGDELSDPRPSMQYWTQEMEEAAQGYAQYILEKAGAYKAAGVPPSVYVEQRLDLREYIPESMGTADCVILAGDTAEVIDFKYGMHRVPAESIKVRNDTVWKQSMTKTAIRFPPQRNIRMTNTKEKRRGHIFTKYSSFRENNELFFK